MMSEKLGTLSRRNKAIELAAAPLLEVGSRASSLRDRIGATTAVALRTTLADQGVNAENITSDHVQSTYNAMTPVPSRPNWESPIPDWPQTEGHGELVSGLIVETRQHPLLVPIVQYALDTLGLSVDIVHSAANAEFITSSPLGAAIKDGRIKMIEIPLERFSAKRYNQMFLMQSFWNTIRGRWKILVFQTDAVFCQNSRHALTDFLHYDYVGSRWHRRRPENIIVDGGNGGLSLRDWNAQIEALRRFPPQLWPSSEDTYFGFHLDLMGKVVARREGMEKFGTQRFFLGEQSFGAHKPLYLTPFQRAAFFRYCPEARALF